MNTSHIKKYAIQARTDFIAAITNRAAQLGISPNEILPAQVTGGGVVVGTITHPASIAEGRQRVVKAIGAQGFQPVIEQVAYTWFNRLVALRFMELHGYLDHGLRVLSNPGDAAVPEVVERLRDLDLPTLDKAKAIEMAMSGQQDEALYRLILLAQCKQLAPAMPWLFDTRLHDGVDLLLPEGLLATDSILAKLVEGIPESEWATVDDDGNDRSVEIIGWLYQFFISERKDEVIGKVVAPEDIPAATQLFTPNWIVQYLVQNSLGRLWLESHPESGLKAHMPYYIEPAEQEPDVQAQLDALVEKGRTPESLKVLDPACGSGHILLEAFRLLFQIYLEQGYRKRDIPRLIFVHNLVGLDIDDRAAQLAGMSLLFEARQHDRRILSDPPQLRVHAFQNGTDADLQAIDGSKFPMKKEAKELVECFRKAKTYGSLLSLPQNIKASLPELQSALTQALRAGDLFLGRVGDILAPLVQQADAICNRYDAIIANPPYMGTGLMAKELKSWITNAYRASKHDLYATFIAHFLQTQRPNCTVAMVTMDAWMFLPSFCDFRESVLKDSCLTSLVHVGWNCFPEVHTYHRGAAFSIKAYAANYSGAHIQLADVPATVDKNKLFLSRKSTGDIMHIKASSHMEIPGSPIASWISASVRSMFSRVPPNETYLVPREGLATGNNERHVRFWWEVGYQKIGFGCKDTNDALTTRRKWFPYNKGGDYRKWYGNQLFVVNWDNNGHELQNTLHPDGKRIWAHNFNLEYIFRESISWSDVTSKGLTMRYFPPGFIFDATGLSAFAKNSKSHLYPALAMANTPIGSEVARILNPTLHFKAGNMGQMPFPDGAGNSNVLRCISLAKSDWDSYERSWNFEKSPLICNSKESSVEDSTARLLDSHISMTNELLNLERSVELEVHEALGVLSETNHDKQDRLRAITLTCNAVYRSNAKSIVSDKCHAEAVCDLLRYAIGCIMGRYSLDHEGLIYAHAGNIDFDPSKYPTFPADDDGIIPLTDEPWFDDDATERFVEFVSKAWPAEGLEENLQFVAEAIGPKKNETPRDTIRRYFSKDFYKDHCTTYKKRPIYWLFSSGKQQAFQCLVYLHRYNADTLGRIRTEYVTPLHGKMRARLANLEDEKGAASSTPAAKKAQKAIDTLTKKLDELATFDDQLRHYADQRIDLDLDDGVKVNIQKFGAVKGKGGLIDLKPLGKL